MTTPISSASEKPVSGSENTAGERLIAAIGKLMEFRKLPQNWDGYGGIALQDVPAVLAGVMLTTPVVVPLGGGGVQFEWHHGGTDIELAIYTDGTVDFFHNVAPATPLTPPDPVSNADEVKE